MKAKRRGTFRGTGFSEEPLDLDELCEKFGIKKSYIASELGLSRSGFAGSIERGFTKAREAEIRRILKRHCMELMKAI